MFEEIRITVVFHLHAFGIMRRLYSIIYAQEISGDEPPFSFVNNSPFIGTFELQRENIFFSDL